MENCSEYEVNINIERQNINKQTWQELFYNRTKALSEMPSSEIYDGWKRAAAKGIDPLKKAVDHFVSSSELQRLHQQNAFYFNLTRPILENINSFAYHSGFNIAISDKNGIILDVLGDWQAMGYIKEQSWIPGADWSEDSIGNNSIGTSLYLDKPVMLIGYEHYCHCCHYWASGAAPVHDVDGTILGSIALCGRFERIHFHTLGMIVAAANSIEAQLKISRSLVQKEETNRYMEIIFNSIRDGIISSDSQGRITFCNNRCCQMLGLTKSQLIGKNLSELFSTNVMTQLNGSSKCIRDKEMTLTVNGRYAKCICTIQHIRNTESFDGIVIALSDYDSMVKLANKIVKMKPRWKFSDLTGSSPAFMETLRIASLAARTDSSVFILGESGTGKDVLAQSIHNDSMRRDEPFVAVNCGAIPKDLIASELFGYSEGAFTGAKRGGNKGKLEIAGNGTIFLDEIGEMPLEQQVVLLRVLDEASFTRVGSSERIPLNARIIAATNKNIYESVQQGQFRQDLFYRLNVFTITAVPLRNRKDDIEALANSFLKRNSEKTGRPFVPVEKEALEMLQAYPWPGNIRELQNVLERAYIISSGGRISPDTLRINNLLPESESSADRPVPHRSQQSQHFGQPAQTFGQPPPAGVRHSYGASSGKAKKDAYEKDLLLEALARNKWNVSKTCAALDISRATLYRWMKRHGIQK